ncbi:MAG TPA: flagellar hook-length control protein FliK [Chloroflexota bacterium]|nr:flagellar hook-length control protein FliK [Chloroflexota bacterium]
MTSPGQDVRARLDLLAQAMPGAFRGDQTPLSHALQRTQATIQAEQFLNGASTERAEQRFFAVTLPTVTGQQPSTLELRVREREAQSRSPGVPSQPDVVQMKLSLPGLGDLGINLMVGQHSVSCHFSAGSAFAETLINASSSQLVSRLKRLGFAHTAVDVAHEPPEPTAPPLAQVPRMNHVDFKA